MKNILCYGDSNTYGTNPAGGRHPWETRWPGHLQLLLGADYHVTEEGMGGRTTVLDDPLEPGRNGATFLPIALASHSPLDFIIIALGVNDCKQHFHVTPLFIARGIERLCKIVKNFDYHYGVQPPRIVIVSPTHILPDVQNGPFPTFAPSGAEISRQLAPYYKNVADQQGALFLDAATVAQASPIDRLHMEAESHISLARALAELIRSNS